MGRHKTCRQCGDKRPLIEFYRTRKGRDIICRECRRNPPRPESAHAEPSGRHCPVCYDLPHRRPSPYCPGCGHRPERETPHQ